ncbi:hypothetical protein C8R43DRAFT_1135138 [Mycena crocata]|nr:hypothetical protein C8R43DRAFT_1135138 [Mycena crocata]
MDNSDDVYIIILHSGFLRKLWAGMTPLFQVSCSGSVQPPILHQPPEGHVNPSVISFRETVNLVDTNDDAFPHSLEFEAQWHHSAYLKNLFRYHSSKAYRFGPITVTHNDFLVNQPLMGFTRFKIAGNGKTDFAIEFSLVGTSFKKTVNFKLPALYE